MYIHFKNMKTFKKYREEKSKKVENMETVMGSHSQPKKTDDKIQNMETVMGSHSQEKKDSESISEGYVDSLSNDDRIHNKSAPVNHDVLSNDHVTALREYTDDSRNLNGSLHKYEDTKDPAKLSYHTDNIKHLDDVLNMHKTKEDMHVFSGLRKSPSTYFKDPKKPQEVKLPAFTSTSSSLKVATGFAEDAPHYKDERHGINHDGVDDIKHVLRIHAPTGTHAMSVMKYSFVPGEKEVLLHRGHHVEIDPTPTHIGNGVHVWDAKIIKHEPLNVD